MAAGSFLVSRTDVGDNYTTGVLPGTVVAGAGLGFTLVALPSSPACSPPRKKSPRPWGQRPWLRSPLRPAVVSPESSARSPSPPSSSPPAA
jgi:hypothetical protein